MYSNRLTDRDLLDTEQAADYLNIPRRTLETWRVRGGGPLFVRVGPRAVRYRVADLEKFIAASTRASTAADRGVMQ